MYHSRKLLYWHFGLWCVSFKVTNKYSLHSLASIKVQVVNSLFMVRSTVVNWVVKKTENKRTKNKREVAPTRVACFPTLKLCYFSRRCVQQSWSVNRESSWIVNVFNTFCSHAAASLLWLVTVVWEKPSLPTSHKSLMSSVWFMSY